MWHRENRIFTDKDIQKKAGNVLDIFKPSELKAKKRIIQNWQKSIKNKIVIAKNETQLQAEFLHKFFGEVLGYPYESHENLRQLETELKTLMDGKTPDGALGYFSISQKEPDVRAVIELKGSKISLDTRQNRKDFRGTPVEQAFAYAPKFGGSCQWIIVSNFLEIRLYHHSDMTRYESFQIMELLETNLLGTPNFQLAKFFFLLGRNSLFQENEQSVVEKLYHQKAEERKDITAKFYGEYKNQREVLLAHLRQKHPAQNPLDLLLATQKLLDRLVFIGFIRDYRLVGNVLDNLDKILNLTFDGRTDKFWQELKSLFSALNKGYPPKDIPTFNGGLFETDNFLQSLVIDNPIMQNLSQFIQKYDFSTQLDVTILGNIFEQSITDIEQLKQEITAQDSSSKRKQDGIFYTPDFITKYMVEKSVGGWLAMQEEHLLQEMNILELPDLEEDSSSIKIHLQFYEQYLKVLESVKILDPACGSGAFLAEVFNFLVHQHLAIHKNIRLLTDKERDFSSLEMVRLKKKVILDNLFGVDLNAESVEITKLSLWLKTLHRKESLAHLSQNIKCGNSLIDDPEFAGEKAFDWKTEFPEIMQNGGFDIVIGNPPYVPTEHILLHHKTFFEQKYQSAFGRMNLYPIFYEQGINLLNQDGFLTFITPYTLLRNQYYAEARKYILQNTQIQYLVDFENYKIFEDAVVDSIILVLSKPPTLSRKSIYVSKIQDFINSVYQEFEFDQETFLAPMYEFSVSANTEILFKLFNNKIILSDIVNFKQGIITGNNKLYLTFDKTETNAKKVVTGSDFNRYLLSWNQTYIKYDTTKLHRPRKPEIFENQSKILLRQTGSYPICTLDTEQFYTLDTVHNGQIINPNFDIKFIISIINSSVSKYIYFTKINEEGKTFAQVKIIYINILPIPKASNTEQKLFITKVDRILILNTDLQKVTTKFLKILQSHFPLKKMSKKLQNWHELRFQDFSKELRKAKIKWSLSEESDWIDFFETEKSKAQKLQTEINKTDSEINKMVYKLYDLTEAEIKLIESSI